jgi:quercetin dioxygenase-like cupin family protein
MALDQPFAPATVEDFVSTISKDQANLGYGLRNEEGEAFWLLGMLQTIRISRDDTAGRYGMLEIVVPAGFGSPWHVHPEEDEWFYVLDGELTFYVGDARLSLPAGSFGFGPKGVPHTFIAEPPDGARALVGFQPMHFVYGT